MMTHLLFYLGIVAVAIVTSAWSVFAIVLFIDQEIGIHAFRERVRKRMFRDLLLWPFLVNPLRWPGIVLAVLLYPLIYLFRVQYVGCFVRSPMKPTPALTKRPEPVQASCSASMIDTLLAQHEGAYTTR